MHRPPLRRSKTTLRDLFTSNNVLLGREMFKRLKIDTDIFITQQIVIKNNYVRDFSTVRNQVIIKIDNIMKDFRKRYKTLLDSVNGTEFPKERININGEDLFMLSFLVFNTLTTSKDGSANKDTRRIAPVLDCIRIMYTTDQRKYYKIMEDILVVLQIVHNNKMIDLCYAAKAKSDSPTFLNSPLNKNCNELLVKWSTCRDFFGVNVNYTRAADKQSIKITGKHGELIDKFIDNIYDYIKVSVGNDNRGRIFHLI